MARISLSAFFIVLILLNAIARAAEKAPQEVLVAPREAIDVIASFEQEVRSVRCDVITTSGETDESAAPYRIKTLYETQTNSHVLLDFSNSRFDVEMEGIGRASRPGDSGKEEKFLSRDHMRFSNDGAFFRTFYRSALGKEAPEKGTEIGSQLNGGLVCKSEDEFEHVQGKGFLKLRGVQTGVVWIPPHWFAGFGQEAQPLSSFLRTRLETGDPFTVTSEKEGKVWKFDLRLETDVVNKTHLRITYDLEKRGVVAATWGGKFDWENHPILKTSVGGPGALFRSFIDENDEFTNLFVNIEWQKVGDHWMPAVVKRVQVAPTALGISRWEYKNVEVNPEVTAADFQWEFPAGIQVTDYTKQKYYTSGTSVIDDEKATADFLDRTGLKVDQASVPPTPKRKTNWLLYANIIAFLVLGAFFVFRRFRKS